jgi:deazaflavin-dependent oxidoreductase (nitroreductase family)
VTILFGDEHVARYRATGGDEGYVWRDGTTILILETVGRRSGEPRAHALIFREYEGAYLLVASNGGSPTPPAWFLNLQAHPDVHVQIKGDRFAARARVATAREKPSMWRAMTQVWPSYDDYARRTDRDIPVVVLDRLDEANQVGHQTSA